MIKIKQDYLSYLSETKNNHYVIIDPPWKFDDRPPKMVGQTSFNLWQDNHKDLERIFCILKENQTSIVWLWVPISLMNVPMEVAPSQGWTYKTTIIWRKLTTHGKEFYGCGHWMRNSVEALLLFVHEDAKIKPIKSSRRNIFSAKSSTSNTNKPRELELFLLKDMKYRYGDVKGAYVFSGPEVDCFEEHNIDCVDIKIGDLP